MRNKQNIKFAFYVSGGASRLIKLIEQSSRILLDTFLVVNDSAPNVHLAVMLTEKNIQYIEFDFADLGLKEKEKNNYLSNLLLQKFKEYNINYCFCFGGRILKGDLLTTYKNKIINFHPSVLPTFPGLKSIDQAVNKNAFLMGNTAHFIDEGVDTGPIIMQNIIHSTSFSDYESVLALQLQMIEQIYHWIIDERLIINNYKVKVKNADYSTAIFYPKLE
jgi:phosphoribosylglycinamide formyltransferase-1